MRIIVFLVIFLFSACLQNNSVAYKNINSNEANILLASEEVIILDVRTKSEISKGYIPNATFIDFYSNEFDAKVNLINKNKAIYVYCKSGGRSLKAVEKMSKMGFVDVYNLNGGFMSWKKADLPYKIDSLFHYKSLDNILTQNYIDSILIVNTNVLICISTQWCMPCRKMEPIIDKVEIELNDKLFVLRLDPDDNPFLIKQYNVLSIPTYVLYKNSLEVWRKNGIIAYSELVRNIN
jgi:rhodanese-related sulfurtransferase|tara:strand:+ start:15569 stop:16276 length:708 start_codon:yes stop_codon:yes gene_type:complete